MVNINSLNRDHAPDGFHQAEFFHLNITEYSHNEILISNRSQHELTMTAPDGHWGVGENYATGVTKVKKIKGREEPGMRILRPAGKLKELTHETETYQMNILGFFELRWKSVGEMSSDDRLNVNLSGEKDRYEYGSVDRKHSETDSIKFKISSKTSRGKRDSTKRHHHRHHKRQPGEQ